MAIKACGINAVVNAVAFAFCLLGIPLLASCSQDDSLPGGSDSGQPALLRINSLQAGDGFESVTRATTAYPTGKFIGFFVKADAGKGYKAVNNRKGTYNATRKQWLPEAATPADSIWLNSNNADIAVYAPYDAAHTATDATAQSLKLTAALRPADGSKDIWCKRFDANNQSKTLNVTMEHLYTRLTLSVSRATNYKAEAAITALALKGNELYTDATYQPFNETTPYIYSTTTGLTPTVAAQTLNATTNAASYDLLMIPATLTDNITLTLTVDGKKMQRIIPKERFAGSKMEAGKQYNVNLKLKASELELTSVSVLKWDALAEVGGQAEFDKEVDGFDFGDFYIAKRNVMATKQADGSYTYGLVEEPGSYSGITGGGDYFCWNTLDPNSFKVYQPDWQASRDVCRQIGDGSWRTPTQAELTALKNAGSVWATYTMKSGTTVNGRYFGTTIAPGSANQDKYIFLPVAGCRTYEQDSATTAPYGDGTYGYYWSSGVYNSTNGYYLRFSSATAGIISNAYRAYGYSVRCVTDK